MGAAQWPNEGAGDAGIRPFDDNRCCLPMLASLTQGQAEALAYLHMLVHLRQAVERLEETAAHEAADAGVGYPQIGRGVQHDAAGRPAPMAWPEHLVPFGVAQVSEFAMMIAPARPYEVLLVEDDPADAMLIEDALTTRGTRKTQIGAELGVTQMHVSR
ncbi:hypothetical protein ACFYXS_35635 [Streptomyces sp. NPDC002574]|uniref:hypothetical protein n=1 Tax=Streptomyces sp. NPDC002574 TaxID=3364652 RepID=UPI00369B8E81